MCLHVAQRCCKTWDNATNNKVEKPVSFIMITVKHQMTVTGCKKWDAKKKKKFSPTTQLRGVYAALQGAGVWF